MTAGLLSVWIQVAVIGLLVLLIERYWLRRAPAWTREALWGLVLLRLVLPAQWIALPGLTTMAAALPSIAIEGGGAVWPLVVWGVGALAAAFAGTVVYYRELHELQRDRVPASASWQRAANDATARLGLRTVPTVWSSRARSAPCVAGILRTAVYVPSLDPDGITATDREHVLLHEFAHLQRRDPLRALLILLVQIAFWFHPIVWLAAVRSAHARELGADARAADHAPAGAAAYGTTLLSWAAPDSPRLLVAAGLAARTRLADRVVALVSPRLFGPALGVSALTLCASLQLLLATPGPRFVVPTFADASELPGCLQHRFLVIQALAAQKQSESR